MLASGNLREEEEEVEEKMRVKKKKKMTAATAAAAAVALKEGVSLVLDNEQNRRDWSSLLPDLLSEIALKLPEISDHIHFRSVCSAWHTISIPTTALFRFPRFPCYFACYLDRHPPSSHCHLLTHNRLHTLRLPNYSTDYHNVLPNYSTNWHIVVGSAFGYLLILDVRQSSISLVNPFTRSQIQLPTLTFLRKRNLFGKSYRAKLIKSEHGFTVVFAHKPKQGHLIVISCCPGDSAWTIIHRSRNEPVHYSDFILHDGKLVLLGDNFTTCIIDLTDPLHRKSSWERTSSDDNDDDDFYYYYDEYYDYGDATCLVESSSGELLMVLDIEDFDDDNGLRRFEVLRLDKGEKPRWSRITNIGDDVLVHDGQNVMCLAASGLDECRGNCIYFWDKSRVGLFDMGAGEVAQLPDSWGYVLKPLSCIEMLCDGCIYNNIQSSRDIVSLLKWQQTFP